MLVVFKNAHCYVLREAIDRLSRTGLSCADIMREIAQGKPLTNAGVFRKVKKRFQSVLTKKLMAHVSVRPNAEARIRHKMETWLCRLSGPPAVLARRAHSHPQRVRQFTTPKVQAATWKTIWNGWCAATRRIRLNIATYI